MKKRRLTNCFAGVILSLIKGPTAQETGIMQRERFQDYSTNGEKAQQAFSVAEMQRQPEISDAYRQVNRFTKREK